MHRPDMITMGLYARKTMSMNMFRHASFGLSRFVSLTPHTLKGLPPYINIQFLLYMVTFLGKKGQVNKLFPERYFTVRERILFE